MFNNIKGGWIIFFAVLFVIFSLSNIVSSENIKIESASTPSNTIKIAGQGHATSTPYMLNDNEISNSYIMIDQSESQNVEIETLDTGSLAIEPMGEDSVVSKPKKKRYKGVSISRTNTGATSAPAGNAPLKNIKHVTNFGKPQGVNAKARSVKAEVKYSDSPRMNKLKERKMKRRAALKKKLEERRARKHLGH